MTKEKKKGFSLPKIGLRNLKTAIAATLCAVLYAIIDRNPTFACIGAVFAMNTNVQTSWETGGNRLWGTMIGGFVGMFFFYIYRRIAVFTNAYDSLWKIIMLFIGIMVMIYISQIFKVNGAIPSGSVVFYIVMLNTPENQYVTYALNRMLDTGIGVLLSILVNIALPRELFAGWSSRDRLIELEQARADIDRDIASLEKMIGEDTWDHFSPQ